MKAKAVSQQAIRAQGEYPPAALLNDFARDLADFFSGRRQGHLEKWEYWQADYQDDPAGGGAFWEKLIEDPRFYYLPTGDIAAIRTAMKDSAFLSELKRFNTIVELGPGSQRSIREKTLPVLKYARRYIAVDQTESQAKNAAAIVRRHTGIDAFHKVAHYHSPLGRAERKSPVAFVMWGGSIGNIDGQKGEDAVDKLRDVYNSFASNCAKGDAYIVSFDTEQDPTRILNAYHEPLLSKKFLSVLHAAEKFGLVCGRFDPALWRHRSEFHPQTGQCAHVLFPIMDQDFYIAGERFFIKALEPRIENNSYKFREETICRVSMEAGFSKTVLLPGRPMTLAMSIRS